MEHGKLSVKMTENGVLFAHDNRPLLRTLNGCEFVTSLEKVKGIAELSAAGLRLTGEGDGWRAESRYEFAAEPTPGILRTQRYTFLRDWHGAICPGMEWIGGGSVRYSYALVNHDLPLEQAQSARLPVDWAMPLPFHLWNTARDTVIYGVDKTVSPGTIAFTAGRTPKFQSWLPENGPQNPQFFGVPTSPETADFPAGSVVELREFIAAAPRSERDPFFDAVKMASEFLMRVPPRAGNPEETTRRIAQFYGHCQLWDAEAFGPGRGWFSNMWVHTHGGVPAKNGEMSGYYDLGWGEGIMPEFAAGAVRHWAKTGDGALLKYVDGMALSIECFRAPGGGYFDRFNKETQRFGDFLMDHLPGDRIWSHSLGHSANQLLGLYLEFPEYPNPKTREAWLRMATRSAEFLAGLQRENGDIPDIADLAGREVNPKKYRIPARLAVAGLWVRMAEATGDGSWLARAERLTDFAAGEVERLEIYGQMLDGIPMVDLNLTDGEAAYYILEGLAPVYRQTRREAHLRLCERAAAWGLAWTYWYDLPRSHNGVSRGGQACRMPDFPLLYPIGPAKAIPVLLDLAEATGEDYYRRAAAEMANFIAFWTVEAPGRPWDGGMIHALGQFGMRYWGPALEGQIDSGMATGNSLAALEYFIAKEQKK